VLHLRNPLPKMTKMRPARQTGGGGDSGESSGGGSDAGGSSEHEENSPKVDIIG
jgi:hypothetical protein